MRLNAVWVISAVTVLLVSGCGFFDVDNPPDPLCGIWTGPYPQTVSTNADSARWAFTENGYYILAAYKSDGTLLYSEVGYYTTDGYNMTLTDQPAGYETVIENVQYEFQNDGLLLRIRQGVFPYRRIGTAEEANDMQAIFDARQAVSWKAVHDG